MKIKPLFRDLKSIYYITYTDHLNEIPIKGFQEIFPKYDINTLDSLFEESIKYHYKVNDKMIPVYFEYGNKYISKGYITPFDVYIKTYEVEKDYTLVNIMNINDTIIK